MKYVPSGRYLFSWKSFFSEDYSGISSFSSVATSDKNAKWLRKERKIYENKINMTETKVLIFVRGWKFAAAKRIRQLECLANTIKNVPVMLDA